MLMKENNLLDEVYKTLARDNSKLTDIWLTHILFSWRWWLLVGLSIIPWIIWIKFRNKDNTVKLLFVGLVVGMASNFLDTMGVTLNLWHYDWKIFPLMPLYWPWDYTLLPVTIMLMLQFKTKINKYIKAIFFAFMCAFVFEPLFSSLGMYHIIHWQCWYSFIIYFLLYIFFNHLYNSKLLQHQSNS